MVARTFLAATLSVAAMIVVAAAAANFVIDPYGMYWSRSSREPYLEVRPLAQNHDLVAKAHVIESVRPKGLLLGNSRIAVGFDPNYAGFPASVKPVYNAGLVGTGPPIALQYLEHAIGVQPPRLVIVGIDFFDFLVPVDPGSGYENAGATVGNDKHPLLGPRQRVEDVKDTLFSFTALVDSVKTILAQFDALSGDTTPGGRITMREFVRITRRVGASALFWQKDRYYASLLTSTPKALLPTGRTTSQPFEALAEIIELSQRMNLQLVLVIYPYHADFMELIDAAGYWAQFEQWKRMLVALVARDRRQHPGTPGVQLWDFSGYNAYTTEPVPADGDTASMMHWYWEPAHFKKELGDVVLKRIFEAPHANRSDEFGVLVNEQNVERHLSRIVAERARYRVEHAGRHDQLFARLRLLKLPP